MQNLLAMTRLESGLIQPRRDWTDMRDLLHSCRAKLTKELAGHNVSIEVSSSLPLVKLDYALFEQVLINLLRNAALHTQADSSITVSASAEGKECIVTIEDNGPGFPPDSLKSIFEKFYRVPGSKTGGIGLGLSIAQGFVQAHGGTMTVENLPDRGAKFTIRLPLETSVQPNAGFADE